MDTRGGIFRRIKGGVVRPLEFQDHKTGVTDVTDLYIRREHRDMIAEDAGNPYPVEMSYEISRNKRKKFKDGGKYS